MASDQFNELPDGWIDLTLGKFLEANGGSIQTGPFGSQLHASDYVESGVPSIMPTNISVEGILTANIARIRETDAKRLSRHRVQSGDIVYSRRGDVEKCALVTGKENGWLCGTGCLRVRTGSSLSDSIFVHAVLSSPNIREWVSRHAIGATMPNLNTSILRGVPISLPPESERRNIAEIWTAIQAKLNGLRVQSQTLESIARAIFKSWFVDFDPVRAKAEGREPEGMDAATAALFPSSFHATPLGPLPEGWGQTELNKLTEVITRGITPKYEEEGYRVINQRCIRDGQVDLGPARTHGLFRRVPPSKLLRDHDILVNSTGVGTLGRVAQIFETDGHTTVDSHVTIVRPDNRVNADYLGTLLLSRQAEIEELASGTTGQTELSREALGKLRLDVPTSEVMRAYSAIVRPLRQKGFQNQKLTKTLSELRDTLLPRLISGKLRVPEAEKLAEALV